MDKGDTLSESDAGAILIELAEAFAPGLFADVASGKLRDPGTWTEDSPDAELRYRLLLDQIPAVVFLAPLDHGIGESYVSRSIERILGYTQEEWLGDPLRWYQRIHPDDRARWSTEAAQLFLSGDPLRSVYRVLARDGRIVWFQCDANMVRRADGRPWFIHGIGFDITEMKNTEGTLREARDAAQAASRAKSEFLANMSHEIRTPMNGIMGMTELALDAPMTAELREYLEVIKSSTEAMLTVIDDILDFSKIEAKKLEFVNAPFRAADCVRSVLKAFECRARAKDVQLLFTPAMDLPVVVGDPVRLGQVLINLVGNAIKFTDHGEVRVDLRMGERTNNSLVLHFLVRDTGIGIPANKQQSIFEAFSQVDYSSTRKYGGTGLGLAISSRLAKLMGGGIAVESEAGAGSTFTFTARFGIAPAGAPEGSISHATPPRDVSVAASLSNGRRARVLLAEDNPVNQKVAARMLEKSGYEVTIAENGLRALETLKSAGWHGFDLVLMDIQMPEMDGFAATAAIRQYEQEHGGHLPIVALTAHAMAGDRERCLEAGMDGYATKPIQLASLQATIEAILKSG